jgi:hypothetical protein
VLDDLEALSKLSLKKAVILDLKAALLPLQSCGSMRVLEVPFNEGIDL